ncbi:cytochrome P450 CYP6004A2 [Atractiella rhizophila]|nr:cytochrome P450 CYP6004A2 [Atractiella rhizophila]
MDMLRALLSPPPTAPDGLPSASAQRSTTASIVRDVLSQVKNGRVLADTATIVQGLEQLFKGEPINDRELLLEHGVGMLQHLPEGSKVGEKAADAFIAALWKDLPHPPVTYVGDDARYRRADGSNNNPFIPGLGKAGSPYSRSVPSKAPKLTNLPDPGLVFDALLRRDKFVPHPSGFSSLFFAFATVVIHECFQTNRKDMNINDTSSYVDLSTLYGNNQEEVDAVRTFEGDGKIWPDVVGSYRIMLMPPKVIAICVLFSRNHNYIAEKLLTINECGKYNSNIGELTEEQKKWQDDDIFHIARNVNVATFASVVLRDYVNAILNTTKTGSNWNLDLGKEIKDGHVRTERGTGGLISVEFNTLYRWHASMSAADATWTERAFQKHFPNKKVEDITIEEFWGLSSTIEGRLHGKAPKEWEVYGVLTRGPDGRFDDEALAKIIKDAVEEPAGAFKARGTPAPFKAIECMGMYQARQYGVCTMNEFRKFLNLKTFDSFLEWNSDPEIAAAAEALYVHVDNLELYPGLLAEEPKPAMTGSGVCVGHTIGRGILDDAVSLVRSDRFLTYDLTPYTLTSWGMQQLAPHAGAQGGLLSKVIFNALPRSFTFNSTYVLFPFFTPKAIEDVLRNLGKLEQYDTLRPKGMPTLHGLNSYDCVKEAFADKERFGVIYLKNLELVTNGRGFMIGWEDDRHDRDKALMLRAMFPAGFEAPMREYFRKCTREMITQKSVNVCGNNTRILDVVRDVCNTVTIHYIAERWGIPIKTTSSPHGLITVPELHLALVVLFVFTSFDMIPATGWDLRAGSLKAAPIVLAFLEQHLTAVGRTMDGVFNTIRNVGQMFNQNLYKSTYGCGPMAEQLYGELMKSGRSSHDLACNCLGSIIPLAGNITQQSALIVDLYLQDGFEEEKKRICQLAFADTKEADEELIGYIREGMRFAPVVVGLPRKANKDCVVVDGDQTIKVKEGDLLLLSTSNAHMDPSIFPDPLKVNPFRPKESYMLMGHGLHYCLGAKLVELPILETIKPIFRLKNIRRQPGPAGKLARYPKELAGSCFHFCLTPDSKEVPMPMSLSILYDV